MSTNPSKPVSIQVPTATQAATSTLRATATQAPTQVAAPGEVIRLEQVSKFYGDVLGINRVSLGIGPGITSLVGPNGAGKSTLLNLVAGLLRPTRGRVEVNGIAPDDPEAFYRQLGYATAAETFPRGLNGFDFVYRYLRIGGYPHGEAEAMSWASLERVGLADVAGRKIGAYSKGMRQRIKLAQALSHDPTVVLLDEPLNGLDPLARTDLIGLFRDLAAEGRTVIVSSHILHEVDLMSDRVILLSGGYVVAEGDIKAVRDELVAHPQQILIRCDRPERVAAAMLVEDHVVAVQIHRDRRGMVVQTRDVDLFYALLTRIVLAERIEIEAVSPADDDVDAVYEYLVEPRMEQSQ